MLKLPTAHQPGQESQAVKAYLPSEVKNTFEKERDGDSILPLFHYTSLPTVFTLQLLWFPVLSRYLVIEQEVDDNDVRKQ